MGYNLIFDIWDLISVFQAGNPLMGHKINLLGHDEHLKNGNRSVETGQEMVKIRLHCGQSLGARIYRSCTFQVPVSCLVT